MRTNLMCCFSFYLALQLKKYLQCSIGIATEQSFRYIELNDAKIWISKNASCRVLPNGVTYSYHRHVHTHAYIHTVFPQIMAWAFISFQ